MRPRSDFGLEVFAGAYLLLRCLVSYLTYYMWERGAFYTLVALANLVRMRVGRPAYLLPIAELQPRMVVKVVDPCSPHFGDLAHIRYSAKSAFASDVGGPPVSYFGNQHSAAHARRIATWERLRSKKDAAQGHEGCYKVDVMPSGVGSPWVKRAHLRVKCTA